MKSNFNHQGLTVIELMVVIFIIALIATVGLVAWQNSRFKAHDAKRIYDIQQYAKAIRLYDLENKRYPQDSDCPGGSCTGQLGWDKNASPNNVLAPFFPALPADPLANGNTGLNDYFYYYHERNPNCGNKPTVSVENMATGNSEYHFNPCVGDSADYLIVLE
ncbi:MAG: hypothetical protein A2744_04060 [Candidatus Buchananbacteria bacterium RIFCSPHIGHO2_01_FULL_44_11]|uniref:Type II secretion system protein GspG C-terminal domain-containing protein n=1 Tax=Candidatus Buchananbacteria bacterium RIFCSPHIGHO2_01_FULL_44_11 TaxID=1797535 RepID=A0A1G1Y2R3_9BACT|nr:MAG: hypothetical protein A2744_04060 [Candidatus Buchananbacteria bacterium RIFCSPHIGHO2_01_FULL_44_11]